MLLLRSVVLALAGDFEPECVAIELQAGIGVGDNDRSVIYAKKQPFRWLVPFRGALAGWKLQDFERVPVGIFEVESPNSRRRLDVLWKGLRTSRGVLNLIAAQQSVSPIHIRGDDGDMLKPAIIAA